MYNSLTLCHSLQLKSEKEMLLLQQRVQYPIPGTPRLAVSQHDATHISVFTEPLSKTSLAQLKELNSNAQAFAYAQTIINACTKLAPIYGFFMINENMIFDNGQQQIFVWINPNYLENKVKIYLPPNAEGEKTMIRSIVSFVKLWLRCDFALLGQANHLSEMLAKLQPVKNRPFQLFRPKITTQVAANRSTSVNLDHPAAKRRYQTPRMVTSDPKDSDGSTKFIPRPRSPDQGSEPQQIISTALLNSVRMAAMESIKEKIKNKTTLNSSKQADNSDNSDHRNVTILNSTSLHTQAKTTFTKTIGINSYFPNKTTSNKNHIVQMILQNDTDPNNFGKNNILLDEEKLMELQQMKIKRLKESLHGIGQQINDLFQSGMLDQYRMDVSGMNREFESLLK